MLVCVVVCSTMFIATWKPAVSQPQLQEWRDQPDAKVQPLMCHAVMLTVVATCTFKAAPATPPAPAAADQVGAHDSVAWHLQVTLVMS